MNTNTPPLKPLKSSKPSLLTSLNNNDTSESIENNKECSDNLCTLKVPDELISNDDLALNSL